MALISKSRFNHKEKIKLEISHEVLQKIEAYCQWSQINISFFMEEAACFIFTKDKEWKNYQKQIKRAQKSEKIVK